MKVYKQIGKIKHAAFGIGGYQDAQIGFSVTLGSDVDCWGCGDFWGVWKGERSIHAKWTEESRITDAGLVTMRVAKLLAEAKKSNVADLVGVPIEASFYAEDQRLASWRILTEVI